MNKENSAQPEKEQLEEIEKYFDEENYHTLIVDEKEFKPVKAAKLEDLLDLLKDEDRNRKEEALSLLKAERDKGQKFLMEAIRDCDDEAQLPVLVAACWESGLDFTPYFTEFIQLCVEEDLLTCIEAVTTIESMEGKIDEKILGDGIQLLQEEVSKKNDKDALLEDLKSLLIGRKMGGG